MGFGESVLMEKSYRFSIRIIKLSKYLREEHREFVLSRQILRSGTAIGALIREAQFAQSDADFTHKLSIALKEAGESEYWIDLLHDTDYLNSPMYQSIKKDIKELIRLLVASVKTTKQKSTQS